MYLAYIFLISIPILLCMGWQCM